MHDGNGCLELKHPTNSHVVIPPLCMQNRKLTRSSRTHESSGYRRKFVDEGFQPRDQVRETNIDRLCCYRSLRVAEKGALQFLLQGQLD